MSSPMEDPAKMKVVELRAELQKRRLDTKGVKAVLVTRLKDALELETNQVLPNTSIIDTSTDDVDESLSTQGYDAGGDSDSGDQNADTEHDGELEQTQMEQERSTKESEYEPTEENEMECDDIQLNPNEDFEGDLKVQAADYPVENQVQIERSVIGTKGDDNVSEEETKNKSTEIICDHTENDSKPKDDSMIANELDKGRPDQINERREKRKRTPTSDRDTFVKHRRSKTPIKEDEPNIDVNKVQLSWFDSDLNLSIDSKTMLSAKPLTEGVFGYTWAGARATHGVSTGKVWYEVKITDELKWDDIAKVEDSERNRSHRADSKFLNDHRNNSNLITIRNTKRPEDASQGGKDSDRERHSHSSRRSKKDEHITSKSQRDQDTDEKTKLMDNEEKKAKTDAEKMDADDTDVTKSSLAEEKNNEDIITDNSKEEHRIHEETKDTDTKDDQLVDTEKSPDDDSKKDLPMSGIATVEKTTVADAVSKEEFHEEKSTTEDTNESEEKKIKEDIDQLEIKDNKKEEPIQKEPIPSHLFRCGWSLKDSSMQLGESKHSFAYESTGKYVTNSEFRDFGDTFGVGDVVATFIEFKDNCILMNYAVNGSVQGETITINKEIFQGIENVVLFPHVLSRNCAFELNFGQLESPWLPLPDQYDHKLLMQHESKVSGPLCPEKRSDCEMILMCGLPASGKTHWVNEYIKTTTDKSYTVIGGSHLLDRMKVDGEALQQRYAGRWTALLDKLQKAANKLIDIASLRRRNFIIDQTNVFPSAQRRKLRAFDGFKRRVVVVVIDDEEQAKRQSLREAQELPENTILEMKANMSLPDKSDGLDEIIFAGVDEANAKEIVKKYNSAARQAGFGVSYQRRYQHRPQDRQRRPYRRNDYRDSNYRDNRYSNYRSDRGPSSLARYDRHDGHWQGGRSGSTWNRDRRDDHRTGYSSGGGNRDWRNNRVIKTVGGGGGSRGGSYRNSGSHNSYNSSTSRNSNTRNYQSGYGSSGVGGSGRHASGGNSWNSQSSAQWNNSSNQGSWNQQSWKYGGGTPNQGTNYSGYNNWNYYGQYGQQNWNQ